MASNYVAVMEGFPDGLVSLGVGLIGVALARWVFVNREVRRTNKRENWRETLPLTLVAMLITSVIILDRNLSISASAFIGLGVGWAAVVILDLLGERVLAAIRGAMMYGPAHPSVFPPDRLNADISGKDGIVTPELVDLPPAMQESLEKLEHIHGTHDKEGD